MLYATVRNRKIYVKSPTSIPQGSENVDVLHVDLDAEWDDMAAITCVFTNTHTVEKTTSKQVVTTVVETVKMNGETEVYRDTQTTVAETEVDPEEVSDDKYDQTTVEEKVVKSEEGDLDVTTTTKTTTTIERPVTKMEEETEAKDITLYEKGEALFKVPHECLVDVGQLSVSLVGVNSDKNMKMRTIAPDSFWDVVESGEDIQNKPSEEQTASLLDQALTAVGDAKAAANEAKTVADDLQARADSGEFRGLPGPQGPQGIPGPQYTLTDADRETIVSAVLDNLPNADQEEF